MNKLWIFVGGLAQLASCASRMMTSVPIEHLYDARPLVRLVAQVRDASVTAEHDFVLVSGGVNVWEERTFTRIRAGANEPLLSMPDEYNWCLGEGLIVRDDGTWWYSRCGGDPGNLLVHFVMSNAPSHLSSLHIARLPRDTRAWLPLQGDDPAGVLLSLIGQNEERLRAELVTPTGTRELGVFERSGFLGFGAQTWQAHRLHDDRIAIVSIEDSDLARSSAIMLRLMRNGEVTESRLPFDRANSYFAIATAIGENGDLAIVGAMNGGDAVEMTVNPDQPQLGRPRILSGSSDAAVPFPSIRVISTGDRFVAAWVRASDHVVRLREFDRRFAFPAISVGEYADRSDLLLVARRVTDGIDLFWPGNDGVIWRRLPERPTGYLLAADLWKVFRQYLDKIVSGRADRPLTH